MAKLQYISRTGKRSYSFETDSEIFAGNISTSNISSSDITAHRLTARSIALQYDSDFSYRAGEIIENGGKLYKANSDMPAGTIFEEGKDALEWSPISGSGGVEPFDSTKEYFANDIVIFNKAFFQAKTDIPDTRGFGDAPFEHAGMDSDWELIHRDVLVDEIHVYQGADSDYANGSVEFPFKTIQHAIINANWNANSVLVIHPGTYEEKTDSDAVSGSYFTFDFGKLDVVPPIAIPGGKGSVVIGGPSVEFILFTQLSTPTTVPDSYYYKDIVFASKADFRAGGSTTTFIENCEFQKGFKATSIFPIVKNIYSVGNDSDSMVELSSANIIGSELGPCKFSVAFGAKDSILWSVHVPALLDHAYADNVIFKSKSLPGSQWSGLNIPTSINKTLVLSNCRFYYSSIELGSSVKYSFNNVLLPTAPGFNKNLGTPDVEPFLNRLTTTAKEIYFPDMDSDFSANRPRVVTVSDSGLLKKTSVEDLFKNPKIKARTEQGRHVDFILGLDSESEVVQVAQSKIEANGYNTNYSEYVHVNNFGNGADSDVAPQKQDGSFLYPYTSIRNAVNAGAAGNWPAGTKGLMFHPGVYDETNATNTSLSMRNFDIGYMYELRAAIPGTVIIGPSGAYDNTQSILFQTPDYYAGVTPYNDSALGDIQPFYGIEFRLRVSSNREDTQAMPYFENCRLIGQQINLFDTQETLLGSYFKDCYIDSVTNATTAASSATRPNTFINCEFEEFDNIKGEALIDGCTFNKNLTLIGFNNNFMPLIKNSYVKGALGVTTSVEIENCIIDDRINGSGNLFMRKTVYSHEIPDSVNLFYNDDTSARNRLTTKTELKVADEQRIDVDRSFAMMMDSDTGEIRKVSFSDMHPGSSINAVFINQHTDDIVQDGTFEHPYKTIQQAIQAGYDSDWKVDTSQDIDLVFFPGVYEDTTGSFGINFYDIMKRPDVNPVSSGHVVGFRALIPGTATLSVKDSGGSVATMSFNNPASYPDIKKRNDGKVPFTGLNIEARISSFAQDPEYVFSFNNCRFLFESSTGLINANNLYFEVKDCFFEFGANSNFTANSNNVGVIDNCTFKSSTGINDNVTVTNCKFRNKVGVGTNATLVNCDVWNDDDENIPTYSPTGTNRLLYTSFGSTGARIVDSRIRGDIYLSNVLGSNPTTLKVINSSYENVQAESGSTLVKDNSGERYDIQNAHMSFLDSEIRTSLESKKFLVVDSDGRVRITQDVSSNLSALGYEANSIFVRRDASQAMTSNTTIVWDSILQQTSAGISYNSSTGEFTVNVAGTYDLFAEVNWNPMTASWAEWRWEKNNARIGRTKVSYRGAVAANESTGETNSCFVDCVVGDVLALKVSATDGNNTQNVRGGFATAKIKQISKQLAITTEFADASDSFKTPDDNVGYSIIDGAQMTYLDGKWQPNAVQGNANAGIAFPNPWGQFTLWMSTSGNRNFRLRNNTGATAYFCLSSDYAVFGQGANDHRSSANDVAGGGDLPLWSDNSLSFGSHGSWEKSNIKIATTRDTMLTGDYTEYEVFCVVGSGYLNNHFTVRRLK